MAKTKSSVSASPFYRSKPKRKNRGIVSKKKTSRNKLSKHYKKKYRGQGRV